MLTLEEFCKKFKDLCTSDQQDIIDILKSPCDVDGEFLETVEEIVKNELVEIKTIVRKGDPIPVK